MDSTAHASINVATFHHIARFVRSIAAAGSIPLQNSRNLRPKKNRKQHNGTIVRRVSRNRWRVVAATMTSTICAAARSVPQRLTFLAQQLQHDARLQYQNSERNLLSEPSTSCGCRNATARASSSQTNLLNRTIGHGRKREEELRVPQTSRRDIRTLKHTRSEIADFLQLRGID